MLAFIDESGDAGFKLHEGASRYFTVALLVFEKDEEAIACDRRIEHLRKELGWKGEFHFYRNSDKIRRAFLRAIASYDFYYYGIVIDKLRLDSSLFSGSHTLYKYACGLVFELAKDKLQRAIVVVDGSGGADFRKELTAYLRRQLSPDGRDSLVRKVKLQRSQSNNLLQLADYIAGINHRSVQKDKKYVKEYLSFIEHQAISVTVWPIT